MVNIELIKGDITTQVVDAVVNAANSSLMGGGGVDGAIHRAGGPTILEECKEIIEKIGSLPPGEAVMTTGGNLPAKHVIHTVGPIWNGGQSGEAEKLANCYINALKIAEEHDLTSIAFPNISTGVYGYPKLKAAEVAFAALKSAKLKTVNRILIVCFDDENFSIYKNLV